MLEVKAIATSNIRRQSILDDERLYWKTYQVMAGTSYQYTGNVALNAGYRYFGASDAEFPLLTGSVDAHAIEFGMRYSF